MKRIILATTILLITNLIKAQIADDESIRNSIVNLGEVRDGDEDFSSFSGLNSILKDVEIVMLGEQSHGDATTFETKIKLIKYLHQELGFDLLAFESGFYDCSKAWQMIKEGENVRDAMGNSLFHHWATIMELMPLVSYIDKNKNAEKPLKLCGFDNQLTGKYSANHLIDDLLDYLKKVNISSVEPGKWAHFVESMNLLTNFESKQLKKNEPEQDLAFVLNLIGEIQKIEPNPESEFWIQMLKSTHTYLSDVSLKTDLRDKQMAENLIWIKEKYPSSKIICWGATSHFLYNSERVRMKSPFIQILAGNYYKKQPMMGGHIKNKFQEKVYTIGFTAYRGEYGVNRKKKIKTPKKGTLEYLLGQSEYDNFLLPLNGLNLNGYQSRPLGNFYMKTDISEVMDAVIFNRDMKKPKLDKNFFLKIYPENKYIKPETAE